MTVGFLSWINVVFLVPAVQVDNSVQAILTRGGMVGSTQDGRVRDTLLRFSRANPSRVIIRAHLPQRSAK